MYGYIKSKSLDIKFVVVLILVLIFVGCVSGELGFDMLVCSDENPSRVGRGEAGRGAGGDCDGSGRDAEEVLFS